MLAIRLVNPSAPNSPSLFPSKRTHIKQYSWGRFLEGGIDYTRYNSYSRDKSAILQYRIYSGDKGIPGIRHIYLWNRVITLFRNRPHVNTSLFWIRDKQHKSSQLHKQPIGKKRKHCTIGNIYWSSRIIGTHYHWVCSFLG